MTAVPHISQSQTSISLERRRADQNACRPALSAILKCQRIQKKRRKAHSWQHVSPQVWWSCRRVRQRPSKRWQRRRCRHQRWRLPWPPRHRQQACRQVRRGEPACLRSTTFRDPPRPHRLPKCPRGGRAVDRVVEVSDQEALCIEIR